MLEVAVTQLLMVTLPVERTCGLSHKLYFKGRNIGGYLQAPRAVVYKRVLFMSAQDILWMFSLHVLSSLSFGHRLLPFPQK